MVWFYAQDNFRNCPKCQFPQWYMSSFFSNWSHKCKKNWQLDCLFAFLGSTHTKAARRTLMKLTPAVSKTMLNSKVVKNRLKNKHLGFVHLNPWHTHVWSSCLFSKNHRTIIWFLRRSSKHALTCLELKKIENKTFCNWKKYLQNNYN